MRFLLRPGWIVLALVVAGFAYLCFTVLAPWQLGKNSDTERRNSLIAAAVDSPTVGFAELVPGAAVAPGDEWRQVEVAGTYVPGQQVLVRLRSVGGSASFEVLTPLRLGDGRLVLVNRGYVLPVTGGAPEVAPPPEGEVRLLARLRMPEKPSGRAGTTDLGVDPQVWSINPADVAAMTGGGYVDGYLQLAEGQPGGLGVIPLPMLDAGPFLSYGLQWIAFGVMAPLGLAYFVRAELRERRKARGTQAPSAAPRDTLADRYGKGR